MPGRWKGMGQWALASPLDFEIWHFPITFLAKKVVSLVSRGDAKNYLLFPFHGKIFVATSGKQLPRKKVFPTPMHERTSAIGSKYTILSIESTLSLFAKYQMISLRCMSFLNELGQYLSVTDSWKQISVLQPSVKFSIATVFLTTMDFSNLWKHCYKLTHASLHLLRHQHYCLAALPAEIFWVQQPHAAKDRLP